MEALTMTPESQTSRHLPPAEAWRSPDKWIDIKTGLPREGIERLKLPTDDRKFVMTRQAIHYVLDTLFCPDYEWEFSSKDPQTRPDDHHFYFNEAEYAPDANNGLLIPMRFRESPTMIGRMPRQLHNVMHAFTIKPEMPEIDAMSEYLDAYALAMAAFRRLFDTAKDTVEARKQFPKRRQSVAAGKVSPADTDDSFAEQYMRSFFEDHFNAYSRAVKELEQIDNIGIVYPDDLNINKLKPHLVIEKFGTIVTRRHIDYTPLVVSHKQSSKLLSLQLSL